MCTDNIITEHPAVELHQTRVKTSQVSEVGPAIPTSQSEGTSQTAPLRRPQCSGSGRRSCISPASVWCYSLTTFSVCYPCFIVAINHYMMSDTRPLVLWWLQHSLSAGKRIFLGHQLPTFYANTALLDLTSCSLYPSLPLWTSSPFLFMPFPLFLTHVTLRYFQMLACGYRKINCLLSFYGPNSLFNCVHGEKR